MISSVLNRPVSSQQSGAFALRAKPDENSGPAESVTLGSHRLSADYDTHRANSNIRGWFSTQAEAVGFHENPTNKDVNQTAFEANLLKDLGAQVRIQNQQDVSQFAGKLPTTTELASEFKKLAADPAIPFEYIVDGCYARAHMMCDTMHKDNINCAKMFVMVENPSGEGKLTAKNKFMNATWWYHVAPLSFAEDPKTHEVNGFIMDPSMADHPLQPKEWVKAMWDAKTNIKIDVTRDPQYGPCEEDGPNKTFNESLDDAHTTAANYSAQLKVIKDDYYAHHPDEKPVAA